MKYVQQIIIIVEISKLEQYVIIVLCQYCKKSIMKDVYHEDITKCTTQCKQIGYNKYLHTHIKSISYNNVQQRSHSQHKIILYFQEILKHSI